MVLAKLYLNAEVYTGTAQYAQALAAAQAVIAGPFSLDPSFRHLFQADNNTSPEMVFVSARRPESGISINFISDRLHYNQFSPAPNNGRAAEPPTYRKFDDDDLRKSIFLVGPQNHLVTGLPVNDRSGVRLNYIVDQSISSMVRATTAAPSQMDLLVIATSLVVVVMRLPRPRHRPRPRARRRAWSPSAGRRTSRPARRDATAASAGARRAGPRARTGPCTGPSAPNGR